MATITDIGIASSYRGIAQPKLKNRWRITFNQFGGALANANSLTMQAVTADRPKLSFDEVEMHRYNSRAWVATKHTWEEFNMSLEDDITNGVSNAIQAQVQTQQLLIANSAGPWLATAPEASIYKFATKLDMLDGGVNVLESWTLEGCWIKSVSYGDLAYAEGDQIKIDLVIRFDHAYQALPQYTQGLGSALGGA